MIMKRNLNPLRPNPRAARGFTFIECVVTLFVATGLMTLAAPSFTTYTATQRIRSASYDLMAAMHYARSEAIKRNTTVDIVKAGSGWASGWRVVAGGTTLRQQDGYAKVNITDSANLVKLTYGNDGRPSTSTTTFKMQPAASINGVTAQCVKILLSGTATSSLGGC